jgi:outer membrane protein TolC
MKRLLFLISNFLIVSLLCGLLSGYTLADNMPIILSRDTVMKLAANHNLDIKLAKIDADYARANVDMKKSVFDIIMEASGGYTDNELTTASAFLGSKTTQAAYNFGISKEFSTGTSIEADFDHTRDYSDSDFVTVNPSHESLASLSLRQPIGKNFFGLEDRGNVRIAELNYQQANLNSLDRIEAALAQSEIAYWNLAYSYEAAELNEDMLERSKNLFAIYEDRFERGIAEEPDVYASEANMNISLINYEIAQNRILNASNLLKIRLNLDSGSAIRPSDDLMTVYTKADYLSHLKEAISKRRDYQAALKNLEAQDINLVIKRNNLWPQIDLVATYQRNGIDADAEQSLDNLLDEDNSSYYVGAEVSIPLENRDARAKKKQAMLLKEQTLLNLKKLEISIASELDNRVRQVNLDVEKIKKWEKIVELQKQKLEAEEKRIKYGRSSSDILVRYQNDLLNSQMSLAAAYLDYHISRIELNLAKNNIIINLDAQDIIKITK